MTLKERVRAAKKRLRDKGVRRPKVRFYDETFGPMLKQESIRYDNLWAGIISDKDFTEKLEEYERAQDDNSGDY